MVGRLWARATEARTTGVTVVMGRAPSPNRRRSPDGPRKHLCVCCGVLSGRATFGSAELTLPVRGCGLAGLRSEPKQALVARRSSQTRGCLLRLAVWSADFGLGLPTLVLWVRRCVGSGAEPKQAPVGRRSSQTRGCLLRLAVWSADFGLGLPTLVLWVRRCVGSGAEPKQAPVGRRSSQTRGCLLRLAVWSADFGLRRSLCVWCPSGLGSDSPAPQ